MNSHSQRPFVHKANLRAQSKKKNEGVALLAGGSRGAAVAIVLAACFDVSGLGLVDHRPIAENGAGRCSFQLSASALAAGQENAEALKVGAEFRECGSGCPTMIVIPAGRFSMGSPDNDDARANERPRHEATIVNPIAVSKLEATFDEWDACFAAGACPRVPDRWGRGQMPAINVSWNDAKQYATWLSRVTGKPYRLLTEAAPPIIAAAVEGRLPRGFGVKRLMDLPTVWSHQWTALGLKVPA